MNRGRSVFFALYIVLCLATTITTMAQEASQEFALPNVRQGEPYRVELESVLRDKYRLRLESGPNAIILWSFASGELPAGLTVQTNGTINGVLRDGLVGTYRFRLKAVDANIRDEALELQFSIEVRTGRLRLSTIDGPRLVPVSLNNVNSETESRSNYRSSTAGSTLSETKNETEPSTTVPPPPPEVETKRGADEQDFRNRSVV